MKKNRFISLTDPTGNTTSFLSTRKILALSDIRNILNMARLSPTVVSKNTGIDPAIISRISTGHRVRVMDFTLEILTNYLMNLPGLNLAETNLDDMK